MIQENKEDTKLTFEKELESLINKYSLENLSDTPDFILAEYIQNSLIAFNKAVNHREMWYGRNGLKKAMDELNVLFNPK